MRLSKAVKVALDETRLLILGAQVLLGFQFQAIFREGFRTLQPSSQYLSVVALLALNCTVGLLIAPSMQHRLVERGRGMRLMRAARRYAVAALAILIAALAIEFFVALSKDGRPALALAAMVGFVALCLMLWFVFPLIVGTILGFPMPPMNKRPPKIEEQIEQMLTEARVILPGVQALLGFQLMAVFAESFSHLPQEVRTIHCLALLANAVAMTLLMTPAALHRIAFGGEDDPRFLRLGSGFVIVAPAFLAAGLAADATVALRAIDGIAPAWAEIAGVALLLFFAAIWYLWPCLLRRYGRPEVAP